MNSKLFNQIYDRLTQVYEFKITDSKGSEFERVIRLRYKQSYSIENNNWSDFQAHRRLIGLITVARSFHDNEIESICELHKTIRDTYTNTLFDSKCFIIMNGLHGEQPVDGDAQNETLSDESIELIDNNVQQAEQFVGQEKGDIKQINSNNQNELFNFTMNGQMDSLDYNSFTSPVDKSSSPPSSIASQVSSPTSSLVIPPQTITDACKKDQVQDVTGAIQDDSILVTDKTGAAGARSRTHSRNKSMDSRLLMPSKSNVSSLTVSQAAFNRTHSSSSLFPPIDRDSSSASNTNEYVRYESDDQCCEQIESRVREFITGLFWVLESKRLDRAREKMEKVPLLMAPFEKKDMIGRECFSKSFY